MSKVARKCECCGVEFYVWPSTVKFCGALFCSMACRVTARQTEKPDAERFWPKVDKRGPNDCWEWTGANNGVGYGVIRPRGANRMMLATRFSYEMHHGPIPAGMCICHKCDNPPCVNPAHLFVGSYSDNMQDCKRKGRASRAPRVFGENHPLAKLTVEQVLKIRSDRRSPKEIARDYGVYFSTIYKIRRRESWGHVP